MPKQHTARGSPLSIWAQTPEANFFQAVDALERKGKVAGLSKPHQRGPIGFSAANRKLDLKIEQQLAEDLAFIAATEPGARGVTAVSVEEANGKLILSVAANSGMPLLARSRLADVLSELSNCTRGSLGNTESVNRILSLITKMDQARIIARLRPKFYKPPLWEARRSQPMHHEVSRAFEALKSANPQSETVRLAYQKLKEFLALGVKLDSTSAGDCHTLLEAVITAAGNVSETKPCLEAELSANGVRIPPGHITTIKDFDKLRRYWFISKRLTALASSSRLGSLFKSVEIRHVENYQSSRVNGRDRFVHAEIQLAIHHRINPSAFPPRYIGVSKTACYLCNLFFQQDGKYTPPATHGVIFEKWTVPDIREYSLQDRCELQSLLAAMYRVVLKAAQKTTGPSKPFPNQSTLFYTPCISTLTLVAAHERAPGSDRYDESFHVPTLCETPEDAGDLLHSSQGSQSKQERASDGQIQQTEKIGPMNTISETTQNPGVGQETVEQSSMPDVQLTRHKKAVGHVEVESVVPENRSRSQSPKLEPCPELITQQRSSSSNPLVREVADDYESTPTHAPATLLSNEGALPPLVEKYFPPPDVQHAATFAEKEPRRRRHRKKRRRHQRHKSASRSHESTGKHSFGFWKTAAQILKTLFCFSAHNPL